LLKRAVTKAQSIPALVNAVALAKIKLGKNANPIVAIVNAIV